jgi:hypothetical protein
MNGVHLKKTTLMIATALAYVVTAAAHAQDPSDDNSILSALPAEVQNEIKDVRALCRESEPDVVIADDNGLSLFTVSGRRAIMINHADVCGRDFHNGKGITYSNRGTSVLEIYVANPVHGKTIWKKALSIDAWDVFLSTSDYTVDSHGGVKDSEETPVFKALVAIVFLGSQECPIAIRKVPADVFSGPVARHPCTTVMKWNGTRFTYNPL